MTVETAMTVPYVDLVAQHAPLRAQLLEAVGRVLDHGLFVLGPEVGELEGRWAKLCEVEHAVSVSNGTAALFLVLRALGIGDGDEVITAPNSFVASASAIALLGARPRFADVGDDFNLDPGAIEGRINDKTKAIVAVHLAGRPAAMDEINQIAASRGLFVVEDAAQAAGARYRNRPVGGLSDAASFSLHPLKTPGACGDAGIITTNDAVLADNLRRLRNHGFTTRQETCSGWGYNARMDTIQAAMVRVKLEHMPEWNRRRRANASIYGERLTKIVELPPDRSEDTVVYHTFPIQVDRRDALVEHLQANAIGCAVHYRMPIHLLDCSRDLGYQSGDLPVAERQATRTVSLPVHEGLRAEQIHHVCDVIEGFLR